MDASDKRKTGDRAESSDEERAHKLSDGHVRLREHERQESERMIEEDGDPAAEDSSTRS